jgi:ATP-binding cassette subfamily F protein 1
MAPHVLVLDEPTNHLDMESVQALIDGIKLFKGGCILVSHDARLISETECDLWVCEGERNVAKGGTGIRKEAAGFETFRDGVLADIQRQAAAEDKLQEQRAEARRRLRAQRINRSKSRLMKK